MRKIKIYAMGVLFVLTAQQSVSAFCGFYVASAGSELFNNKSQVILVRDGNKSTITMSNDFRGNVKDFAMVIPVPTVLKRNQVKVLDQGIFTRLDNYSAPRLVEYFDNNPCHTVLYDMIAVEDSQEVNFAPRTMLKDKFEKEYGVSIEEQFSVAEYDIIILSATESDGLKRWLTDNGYQIPAKAEKVLKPYIRSNMKFFVVKVNLERKKESASPYLRPIQISFESPKFMLPIRLGMANSTGEQDMIVYALTKNGRIETANYRTTKLPTNRKVPLFVKQKFGQFYKDMFEKEYRNEGKNTVFLEYSWNVSPRWPGVKCDPCVGAPPIFADLKRAGVDWLNPNGVGNVFFTRLHVRYSEAKFPQDLMFINTPNSEQFQGRYILTHPATGDLTCSDGVQYVEDLKNRRSLELQELGALTGWNTSKYHKYAEKGTGEIDERRFDSGPIGGSAPKGPLPGLPYLFFGLSIVGMLIVYIKSKKRNSQVQLKL
jgi:hypothetical protein